MRIGILTFHRAFNCGAMLQAWALRKTLEGMGHTVVFPRCNNVGYTERFFFSELPRRCAGLRKIRAFVVGVLHDLLGHRVRPSSADGYNSFRGKYLEEVAIKNLTKDPLDLIVIGSDQVWNRHIAAEAFDCFVGGKILPTVPRIAYAASAGDSVEQSFIDELARKISTFKAISVREALLAQKLSRSGIKAVENVVDPTFLISKQDYERVAEGSVPKVPYLYLYTLAPTKFELDLSRKLANLLGVSLYISSVSQPAKAKPVQDGIDYTVSPQRMVKLIENAEYVLASSFHGTALSLIFRKKFLSLRNNDSTARTSRPAVLLESLGCGERLVTPSNSIEDCMNVITTTVSEESYRCLEGLRNNSKRWLEEAIKIATGGAIENI